MIWILVAYVAGLLSAVALAYLALAALEGVDPPDHTEKKERRKPWPS